ncbi:MAG TPA: hypothetical protein VHU83_24765 [Bryobacteraceae bacterium]|nr:hypothetical protein [Bryobacteraceae bacterium]
MANRKNNLSSLLNQLSGQKIDGQSVNKLLGPTSVITQAQSNTEKTIKPPSSGDTKTSAMGAKTAATGINFGSPSNNRPSTSQSGSEWANLLTKTASGGIASAFSGGLSSIAGLGGLISGIASLFGGGSTSTPPPLVEFQLPSSQTQTIYVSSTGSSTYQGSMTEQTSGSSSHGSTYISSPTPRTSRSTSSGQSFQYQSTQIAQAVKTALLNSSSLNDVIAEI